MVTELLNAILNAPRPTCLVRSTVGDLHLRRLDNASSTKVLEGQNALLADIVDIHVTLASVRGRNRDANGISLATRGVFMEHLELFLVVAALDAALGAALVYARAAGVLLSIAVCIAVGFAAAGAIFVRVVGGSVEDGLEEWLEARDRGRQDANVALDNGPDGEVGAIVEEVTGNTIGCDVVKFDYGGGGSAGSSVSSGSMGSRDGRN